MLVTGVIFFRYINNRRSYVCLLVDQKTTEQAYTLSDDVTGSSVFEVLRLGGGDTQPSPVKVTRQQQIVQDDEIQNLFI